MPDAHLTSLPPSSHPSVIVGMTPNTLLRIREAAVSLAVWERSMPPEVERWLDQVLPETLPTARFICRGAEARRDVLRTFAGHADADSAACLLLKEDIIAQIERFARICGAPWTEVRLEVITSNACAKFHADNVSARLLTTYRGPATEWLDPAVEDAACCPAHAPEAGVRQLPRFAVALIKGRKAKSRSGPLVLHRSPPIEGSGQSRLFLCVNDAIAHDTGDGC